ncbi:uncharacterized protein METZ01_LOCUS428718, partial [marine metagenome]
VSFRNRHEQLKECTSSQLVPDPRDAERDHARHLLVL